MCHVVIETPASSIKEPETKSPGSLESNESTQSGTVLWKKWQITKSLKDLAKSLSGESGGASLAVKEEQTMRKENISKCQACR